MVCSIVGLKEEDTILSHCLVKTWGWCFQCVLSGRIHGLIPQRGGVTKRELVYRLHFVSDEKIRDITVAHGSHSSWFLAPSWGFNWNVRVLWGLMRWGDLCVSVHLGVWTWKRKVMGACAFMHRVYGYMICFNISLWFSAAYCGSFHVFLHGGVGVYLCTSLCRSVFVPQLGQVMQYRVIVFWSKYKRRNNLRELASQTANTISLKKRLIAILPVNT